MQINLDRNNAIFQITSYNSNTIFVNQTPYSQSIIISPSSLHDWNINDLSQLSLPDIIKLQQNNPSVIIVGTGNSVHQPSSKQVEILCNQGCHIDFMSTPAACRTYSILAAEQRNFVMGLIISNPKPGG
jgi:uncharacterized protein